MQNFLWCEKAVADPVAVYGGKRNMKFMQPTLAVIFFMTYFYRAGAGGMAPLYPSPPPPDPLLESVRSVVSGLKCHLATELWSSLLQKHFYLVTTNVLVSTGVTY